MKNNDKLVVGLDFGSDDEMIKSVLVYSVALEIACQDDKKKAEKYIGLAIERLKAGITDESGGVLRMVEVENDKQGTRKED